MTNTTSRMGIATLLLAVSATACNDGAQRHTSDGDTGAAAPATVRDMSATPNVPDSGHSPTGVARSDSVRRQSTGGPGTPAIRPPGTPER